MANQWRTIQTKGSPAQLTKVSLLSITNCNEKSFRRKFISFSFVFYKLYFLNLTYLLLDSATTFFITFETPDINFLFDILITK